VTYLSLVDDADDSPLEFFGEFPAIKDKHKVSWSSTERFPSLSIIINFVAPFNLTQG
jgi:hypothetical protein